MNLFGSLWNQSKKHKWIVISSFIVVLLTASYLVISQIGGMSEEEEIALQFYKALWVEGNRSKAESYIAPGFWDQKYVKWVIEEEKDPSPSSPVLMVEEPEGPEYKSEDKKLFYIYEPVKDKIYGILLIKLDGKWQVQVGGRLEEFDYASLNRHYPGLKEQWKEFQLP
ncbi:hypothetical protein [Hazenella coriacea]|uniref:Uncharacterized protein n=1 Tax=Hazenella coriacea TaxID=1179467 RepID=A0A4R3L719_9BACL|nr:hypothetical protein [Hazenella coriacea]TCS95711.1 hypothetical protein EDD58_102287 [Hazenella coriacea]